MQELLFRFLVELECEQNLAITMLYEIKIWCSLVSEPLCRHMISRDQLLVIAVSGNQTQIVRTYLVGILRLRLEPFPGLYNDLVPVLLLTPSIYQFQIGNTYLRVIRLGLEPLPGLFNDFVPVLLFAASLYKP